MICQAELYAAALALIQSWNWTAGTRTDLAADSNITAVETCKIFLYQMHTELKNNHNKPSFLEVNEKILGFFNSLVSQSRVKILFLQLLFFKESEFQSCLYHYGADPHEIRVFK